MDQTEDPELKQDIARYLATGDSDQVCRGVPGSLMQAIRAYDRHLRDALLAEVQRREAGGHETALPVDLDLVAFTRRKVTPMIHGLFSATEWPVVLAVAEQSIVFLTREVVHRLIHDLDYRRSAWTIATIYLRSLGLASLDGSRNPPLGCNEHVTCYVSLEYFRQTDPFADYVVHEVAHIFHNCKRRTIGLPSTRGKEWVLDIAFSMRETFAYACEVYSRILERASTPAERRLLLAQYAKRTEPEDERVNQAELVDILNEAVNARNGWKRILGRCSNGKRSTLRPAG
jgi:hypothetical protein